MGAGMEGLRRDYLPDELTPLLQSAGVAGTGAVQARQVVEESRWLLDLASRFPAIKGVVGWVDLRSPHVGEQLAGFSDHPKFCGVRHVVHDEADDQFMLGPEFLRGLGLLAQFHLTYDLLIFPRHLGVAVEVVKQFPEQLFVVDHIAKPSIRKKTMRPWEEDIRDLASFDNVFCKVSGMVTEADWQTWEPTDFRPYLDVVFESFGSKRIMLGSDWPVCTVAGTYTQVMDAARGYIQDLSESEQSDVRRFTATRFYQLSDL